MKKITLFMLAVFMIFTVSGCSSDSEGLYPETREYGLKAIDTINQYLDEKISSVDAVAQLEDYANILKTLEHKEPENENDLRPGNNMLVESYISSAVLEIDAELSVDLVINSRDNIKDLLESPITI